MPFETPGGVNPFEAPRAGIGERALNVDVLDTDAELIRREHLGREANIKSLGQLNYLGAFFGGLYVIAMILMASGVIPVPQNQQNGLDPSSQKFLFAGMAVVLLLVTVLYGALGYGLTHLQNWARWTLVAFTSLGLVGALIQSVIAMMINPVVGIIALIIGGGINALILYLLVSSKAGVVFSPGYKDVIRKTPHIKQKTSIIVKILAAILLLFIALGVLAAILAPRS